MFKNISIATLLLLSGTQAAEEAATAVVAEVKKVEICVAGASAANVDGGKIHSAFFDNENCIGFSKETFSHVRRSAEETKAAKKYKCRVVSSVVGKTEVAPIEDVRKDITSTNRPMDPQVDIICPGLKTGGPYDQLFVTFNFPVVQATLEKKGTDFTVTTAEGKKVVPLCAILDPGQEGNEGHQVQLLGDFGGKLEAQWPKSVQVTSETLMLQDIAAAKAISAKCLEITGDKVAWKKGNAQYGQGLAYTSGQVALRAWIYKFDVTSQDGYKGEWTGGWANHCHVNFKDTTHVIKVLFSAPVSKNGVNPYLPTDTHMFTIKAKKGKTAFVKTKIIGLADLGYVAPDGEIYKTFPQNYLTDEDSYIDICLKLDAADVLEDLDVVTLTQTVPNAATALQQTSFNQPSGNGGMITHDVAIEKQDNFPSDMGYSATSELATWSIVWDVALYCGLAVGAGVASIGVVAAGYGGGIGLIFAEGGSWPN